VSSFPDGVPLTSQLPKDERSFPAKRIVGWNRFLDLPQPTEYEELGLKSTYKTTHDHRAGSISRSGLLT
jgi:hypothetical protein